jgi:hypothetical protein
MGQVSCPSCRCVCLSLYAPRARGTSGRHPRHSPQDDGVVGAPVRGSDRGQEYLRDSHRKIEELMTLNFVGNDNQSDAREDFLAMLSVLAQYINHLNVQNLLMYPWKHTAEYPIPRN